MRSLEDNNRSSAIAARVQRLCVYIYNTCTSIGRGICVYVLWKTNGNWGRSTLLRSRVFSSPARTGLPKRKKYKCTIIFHATSVLRTTYFVCQRNVRKIASYRCIIKTVTRCTTYALCILLFIAYIIVLCDDDRSHYDIRLVDSVGTDGLYQLWVVFGRTDIARTTPKPWEYH